MLAPIFERDGIGLKGNWQEYLVPLASLFYLDDPGHIMLYLGEANEKHYAIHNLWSYWTSVDDNNIEIPVRQVIVPTINLGANGKKGDSLHRMSKCGILKGD